MLSPLRVWMVVSLALAATAPALAFDFIVTEYTDNALTFDPGCTVVHCTLREAVIAANAGVDADRILLSAGVYAINLVGSGENLAATGDLDIRENTEIVGVGAGITILDAADLGESALTASDPGLVFALRGVTVRNSSARGVVLAIGAHTVEDCELTGNVTGISTSVGSIATLRRVSLIGNGNLGLLVSQSTMTVENSTFSGNGGRDLFVQLAVAFSCSHCTIADAADSDSEINVLTSTISFTNSIVAGDCVLGTGGAISSLGGNVESPGNTCNFAQGTDLNTQTSGDLDLAALADNGGPTRTHLPGGASVANGNTTCALATDQRGVARVSACESGAVELTTAAVATPIFNDGFLQGDPDAWSASVGFVP